MSLIKFKNIKIQEESTVKTGNATLDDFLSNDGGFVIGSSIFLTGTSGAGKTTFSFVIQNLLSNFITAFYSREMSESSVKNQMKRYDNGNQNAFIADRERCPSIDSFVEQLELYKPKVVIVDSLQVIMKEDFPGLSEEKSGFEIIQKLRTWTEKNNAVLIMIGHVNKDGEFEGRNTIQHMFDVHVEMIYDKKKNTRTLSFGKNRKGDAGKMLYYEFGKKTILFFSENEYKARKENMGIEDFIAQAISSFVGSLSKENPNYKTFKKELNKEIGEAEKENGTPFEFTMIAAVITKKLAKKHGLI